MLSSPSYRVTALLLISISCLVLGSLMGQERELAKSLEPGTAPQSRPANPEGSAGAQPGEISSTAPGLTASLALAVIFGASLVLFLARGPTRDPRDEQGNPALPDTPGSDSTNSGTDPRLAHQFLLSEAKQKAVITEFAAKLSHDLRNPLAGIQMSLSNIVSESQDADLRERLELLHSESVRVADLLSEAVASSRDNPEPSQDVDLAPLVESVLELIAAQTSSRIELAHSVQEGLRFRLPPLGFQNSVGELVLNAAEAIGEGGGSIRVEAELLSDHLRVSVADTGPGFPEELLLGASQSVDPDRRRLKLGLAAVHRFARAMGGKLEISNQSSNGNPSGGRATILLPFGAHHG